MGKSTNWRAVGIRAALIVGGCSLLAAIIHVFFNKPSTSVSVQGSPGAIVPLIQDSPNASQSITGHQGPKKRAISPEQAEVMKPILAQAKGSTVSIIFKMNNSECEQFSAQLEKVFAEAGWNVERISTVSVGGPHLSLWLRVSSRDVQDVGEADTPLPDGHVPIRVPHRMYVIVSAIKAGLGKKCEIVPDEGLKSGEMDLRVEEAD